MIRDEEKPMIHRSQRVLRTLFQFWWLRYAGRLAAAMVCFSGAAGGSDTPPPLPDGYFTHIANGDSGNDIWVQYNSDPSSKARYSFQRWNAQTEQMQPIPLPNDFSAEAAVSVADGLVLSGTTDPVTAGSPKKILWTLPQGGTLSVVPPLQRSKARLLALADQSVLLVAGSLTEGDKHTNAVERVKRVRDALEVERLPDIPGPVRHSYALVALPDGRAMVLGGTQWEYIGCQICVPDTFILDPKTQIWSLGPKMLEARADASTTLMPDGSVLVAGGWTPGHDWNEEASRTTERWDPYSNRFTAGPPLPIAVAMHQVRWAPWAQGQQLLLAGGMVAAWEGNDVVLAFDVPRAEWRAVAEGLPADGHSGGRLEFGALMYRGTPFVWYESGGGPKHEYVRLRLPSVAAGPRVDGEDGHALRRAWAAYAIGPGDVPALAAGGNLVDTWVASAAVDAILPDGQIRALASLNHARRGARLFRLPGGAFLLAGGSNALLHDRNKYLQVLPYEWLSGKPDLLHARWQELGLGPSQDTALGQDRDGSLIMVFSGGRVERMSMAEAKAGTPTLVRTPMPDLNRTRSLHAADTKNGGQVRGLPDGRIIVAGGIMHRHSIAVLQESSMMDEAPDVYAEVGESEIARRYEIHDPVTNRWRTSVASPGEGGPVAVLDNGQVVMLTPSKIIGDQKPDGTWPSTPGLLEISGTDGQSWQAFGATPLVQLNDHARPFVIDGELLLSGESAAVNTGGGPSLVQWYDPGAKQWVTLWEAPAKSNWRDHNGRVIVRKLANGKRLVIPVEGL